MEEDKCHWCEVRISRSNPHLYWICDYESAQCDFHPIAYNSVTLQRTGDTGPHQTTMEMQDIIRRSWINTMLQRDKSKGLRAVDSNVVSISRKSQPTSKSAAGNILPRSGTIRRMVFNEIVRAGGLTDHELEMNLNGKHQTISASRRSLVVDGYIVDSGETRKNPQGNECIVWEFVQKGINQQAWRFYV